MSKLIMLDEAIEWGKRGELCDLMTEDDQRQIAEWLRQARGAESAARWYTAKPREAEAENAKLRELVADAWGYINHPANATWTHMRRKEARDSIGDRMRELGIEVDDG